MTSNPTNPNIEIGIRIYDTPIASLPDDLYIPPQAFAIWLEQFAGPLDFLLYLVKKNNFDLTETAILPITEQYLAYIKELDDTYFELAGDYLLMASTLIAIKSELLLPQPDIAGDEPSPKARLIRRLEEYAQIKEASIRLDKLIRLERDVFVAYASLPSIEAIQLERPKFNPEILINSLINMQIRPVGQMHTVKTDLVPLPDRIAKISRILSEKGMATFYELLDKSQGRVGVVVSFVAILELVKRGLVGFGNDDKVDETDDFELAQTPKNSTKAYAKSEQILPHKDSDDTLGGQMIYWLH
ncbi:segregation and condensation protein A [Moraxella oblonga]|uniref:segregation and condensation protein A n=1 Tax=Moraxella oblonga TaxID=200413 RepID=UPI000A06E4A5|nr:ScpA family protein [Moraxella oblonga]